MNIDLIPQLLAWVFNPYACWVAVVWSLIGSYFNATMRIKLSYIIWLPSNIYLVIYNIRIGQSAQGVLFSFYLFFNLIGLKNTFGSKGSR
ncbi:MAG: hypothetical protein LBD54_02315 [Puniceicoccales bacterium]|jgi:hypothetical protein|nr:hypothetical protein [Puniceicoccales bacterium]